MDTELQNKIDEVQNEILTAFANVSLGEGVGLREAGVIDRCGTVQERAEARKNDEKCDWQSIPYADIEDSDWQVIPYADDDRVPSALCFMDAEGLRFHIPAFMRFTLLFYFGCDNDLRLSEIIYQLCDKKCIMTLLGILNEEQVAATTNFLKVCIEIGDYWIDTQFIPNALIQWEKGAK